MRKTVTSPVTGKITFLDCLSERAFSLPTACGPEGKHFVARAEAERAA
jgi:hypothetical protein